MSNLFIASAFLALLYILYAVIQTVRGKTCLDKLGALLACLAVIIPLVSLALDTVSAASQPILPAVILANAAIVLVISAVIVILDYRRPQHQLGRSFGTLGLGVSVLLVAGLLSTPLILAQFPSATTQTSSTDFSGLRSDTLVPAAFSGDQMPFEAPTGQQMPAQVDNSDLQSVLQNETGLTTDELLAQLNAGSTIADLVTAQGGQIDLVTSALTTTLEAAISEGAFPAPILDRLGGDAASVASSAVQGEIPPMFLNSLLGGAMPQGNPPAGFGQPGAASGEQPAFVIPDVEVTPTIEVEQDTVAQPVDNQQTAASVPMQTARATSTPLPTPTPFMFDVEPTATQVEAEVRDTETQAAAQTCTLTVNFNLNMRAEPNIDGAWIVTIPAYTSVTSTGQNGENWWQVSYEEATGWVSGEYLTPDRTCDALPAID